MTKNGFRNFIKLCIEYKDIIQEIGVLFIAGISPFIYKWSFFQNHPCLCSIIGMCVLGVIFWWLYCYAHREFNFYNDNFCYYTITSRLPSIYKKYTGKNWDIKEKTKESTLWATLIGSGCFTPKEDQSNHADLYEELVGNKLKNFSTLEEVFQNVDFLTAEHYFYYLLYKRFRELDSEQKQTQVRLLQERLAPMEIEIAKKGMEIIEYDPYYKTKMDSLQKEQVEKSLNTYRVNSKSEAGLFALLIHCVGANTSDLSQEGVHIDIEDDPTIKPNDFKKFNEYLEKLKSEKETRGTVQVDILTDNCGLELLSDIELAVFMLNYGLTDLVVFHVRVLPQYVSDVTKNEIVDDFEQLLDRLNDMKKNSGKKMDYDSLLEDVQKYKNKKQICVKEDLFWNLPTYYYDHKEILKKIIGTSDLVIVKGDLNYRKLVGDEDHYWCCSFRHKVQKIGYPVLALRAIKSSLVDVCGSLKDLKYRHNIIHNINGLNGDYGVIRFYNGAVPTRLQRICSSVGKFLAGI